MCVVTASITPSDVHRLKWPGYEQSGRYLHVQNDGLYITRGRLANLVCETVRHFFRAASVSRSFMKESGLLILALVAEETTTSRES